MKIGFSLSQCIQDIYDGKVEESEVFLIQTGTLIKDSSYIRRMIQEYIWDGRMGGDLDKLTEIATKLYLTGKLYEPRAAHHRPTSINWGENWAQLIAPVDTMDENVKKAYQNLLMLQKLAVEKVATLPEHLKNDKAINDNF